MSSFGENYKKNDLLDDIQHYFSDGGTIEEMFDVLRYIFEYGKTPFNDLQQENQSLKKQLEEKENQQKKFIDYLEDCINELKKENMNKLENTLNLGVADVTKIILSKYKEVTGGK